MGYELILTLLAQYSNVCLEYSNLMIDGMENAALFNLSCLDSRQSNIFHASLADLLQWQGMPAAANPRVIS